MLKFDTVVKKSSVVILSIGMVLLFAFNLILPSIFYQFLKPTFVENVSDVLDGVAAKCGFILYAYTTAHGTLQANEEVNALLSDFATDPQRKDVIRQSLNDYFTSVPRPGPRRPEKGAMQMSYSRAILSEDNDYFCSAETEPYLKIAMESDWYRSFLRDKRWGRAYSPVFTSEKDGEPYQFICYIMEYASTIKGEQYYTMLVVNFSDFLVIFNSLTESEINDYVLYGHDNLPLYTELPPGQSSIVLDEYPADAFQGEQYEVISFENKDGVNLMIRISFLSENLRLAVHVPRQALLAPYQTIFLFFQLFMGFSFLIFIVMTVLFLKQTLRNLSALSRNMEKVKAGDYDVQVDIDSKDEIGKLADTFNLMMQTIKSNISDMIQYERKQQELQYIIVVSEINPHFIYNTLNTITFLASANKTEDIIEVNRALIATLKERLKIKSNKSFDTIQNEIQVLENYLLIQNHLSYNRIELITDIEEGLLQTYIPKNILQPLVENSVLHGLQLRKTEDGKLLDGEIRLSIHKKAEMLQILVADNGIGMESEQVERYFHQDLELISDAAEHIGIRNIRARLSFLYGEAYHITVQSEKGKGTTIIIAIPLQSNRLQLPEGDEAE